MTSTTLPLDHIHPVIRVAHRVAGVLSIPTRVIVDHELVLILRGRVDVVLAGHRKTLAAHHLLCVPPELPHAYLGGAPCEHLAVHFDFTPAARPSRPVILGEGLAIPLHQVLNPDDAVEQCLLRLLRSWGEGGAVGRLSARAALADAIARLVAPVPARAALVETVEQVRMRRAAAFIRAHWADRLSVAAIAHAVGLSASRFAWLFPRWGGYAPMEYQRRLRVAEARRLLADPAQGVAEVGRRCGFADPYHFSRVFRRIDGLSPQRYRAALIAPDSVPAAGGSMPASGRRQEKDKKVGKDPDHDHRRRPPDPA